MKTFKTKLLTIAILLCSISASAYDFEVDGIYYSISSIEELTVSVTSGDNTYSGEIIIPEEVVFKEKTLTVTSIEKSAFSRSYLESVTIGDSVTTIGIDAFKQCFNLTSVTIGNSVKSIGSSAFSECLNLTSVTIGDGVTNIGHFAFYNCSSLTSITIPNSVTTIGDGAFYKCSNLTSITIPNSVTSIGRSAFYDCSSLTSITIPNSVTTIEDNAFSGCFRLKELCFEDGTNKLSLGYQLVPGEYGTTSASLFCDCPLKTLYLGRDISSHKPPFRENETLTSVTIGNSMTSIGYYIFSNCSNLTSVFIPNSVTSITTGAFYKCSNLTSITIPNSVTTIGDYAFEGCSFTELKVAATAPPTVGSGNFDNSDYINIAIKVPEGSLEAYQAADVWKSFWDIQEDASLDIKNAVLETEYETAPIYNLQGVQMKEGRENLPAGIYIQGGKKMIVR